MKNPTTVETWRQLHKAKHKTKSSF